MATATERFSDQKKTQAADGNWIATRAWDVVNFISEDDAIAATGVTPAQAHNETAALKCDTIGLTENKLTKGIVTAQYKILPLLNNPANPTSRNPFISWRWGKQSLPSNSDIYGNPILNSAFDGFSSYGTRNFSSRFLTIERWEAYYDDAEACLYVDTVNNGTVTFLGRSYTAGQMMLLSYAPVEKYQIGAPYVKVAYAFEIRTPMTPNLTAMQIRHPFQRRLLDQGLRGISQVSSQVGPFFLPGSTGGNPPTQATRDVLLNGHAQPVQTGIGIGPALEDVQSFDVPSGVLLDSSTNATFLIYLDYAETDFTAIGVSG